MLARLDQGLAPARASVNREGTLLRLDGLDPEGTEASVESAVSLVAEMGYVAEIISTLPGEVIRWYGSGEVDELSAEETRILTQRWTEELLRGGLIRKVDRQAASGSVEFILSAMIREAARSGAVDVDPGGLPREAPEGLPEEVFELVRGWILRRLAVG